MISHGCKNLIAIFVTLVWTIVNSSFSLSVLGTQSLPESASISFKDCIGYCLCDSEVVCCSYEAARKYLLTTLVTE